jgi:hypothetical protein
MRRGGEGRGRWKGYVSLRMLGTLENEGHQGLAFLLLRGFK